MTRLIHYQSVVADLRARLKAIENEHVELSAIIEGLERLIKAGSGKIPDTAHAGESDTPNKGESQIYKNMTVGDALFAF